jgi:hypothetical protein
MTVYNVDGSYLADSLRKAAEIIGCSHTIIAANSHKKGDDFYLLRTPTPNTPGRPKGTGRVLTFNEIMERNR